VPDPRDHDWFNEFKKANTELPPPAPPRPAAERVHIPPKGSERRRHGRFEVDQVSSHLYKDGILALIGVGRGNLARATIDVSEGGAQLLVHERLPAGTKVRVKIAIEKYKDTIEASGVIRWCYQSAKKKEDFFVGVQFDEMTNAQTHKVKLMRDWFTSPQFKAFKQSRPPAFKKNGNGQK
jgi:hypothetical protein